MGERLRPYWKQLLVITAVTGVAITVVGPDHVDLQNADDALAFRLALEHPGRQVVAALIDIVFAVAYGLLGILGMRVFVRPPWLARVGAAVIVIAAVADELENLFLVRNIVARESLTDGWIDAMQVPGTVKWIGPPMFLVLLAFVIADRARRRDNTRE